MSVSILNKDSSFLKEFTILGFKIPFDTPGTQAIILFLIAILFYANTLQNQYAMDDGLVILENEFVKDGFGGIGDIMTHDIFYSYYKTMGSEEQLAGGRYRPLSLITYAIEYELFGEEPFIGHLTNVLLYGLLAIALFYFLLNAFFREQPVLAFVSCLLFVIHPIHTEVVANIKSRDEILSLLFIMLTLLFAHRYVFKGQSPRWLALSLLCFFLALLSKEYGIALLGLFPVLLIINRAKVGMRGIITTLLLVAVAGGYIILRITSVGINTESSAALLNNPYLLANSEEKLATKLFILGKYLKLLFFPHPLSYDYSYNQIAYKSFGSLKVWLSVIAYAGITISSLVFLLKRHWLAFAGLLYLSGILLVSNLIFEIGAPMGERLVFYSSVGFTMAAAFTLLFLINAIPSSTKAKNIIAVTLLGMIVISAGYKTITRNGDWENDMTLFIKDVNISPNSALTNGNAGARFIDKANEMISPKQKEVYLDRAILHLKKAIDIYPGYTNALFNLGTAYYQLDDILLTEYYWNEARKIYPNHPNFAEFNKFLGQGLLVLGLKAGEEKNFSVAIEFFIKATTYDPSDAEIWYNLGGAYFTIGSYTDASNMWKKALELDPEHEMAAEGLKALEVKQITM